MTAPTYRALLIANSTFPSDAPNLPELEGPRNDAALLRDALCDREYGLFAGDNVRLVQERRMSDVLREVEDFLRSASRDDTLLLYYSGHGVLDQSNELFLCAQDSRTDRLRSTAIKASDVSQMIDESAARTTMILLDCCHSGRFKGGDVTARLGGEGRFVLTSSRSIELARDALAPNRASVFTNHVVEGLLGRAQDHDEDGVVNLSELYDYVHEEMRATGSHVPQKRFEGSGEIPVALRPTAGGTNVDVVDPVEASPVLDVSTTAIDLGPVDEGETLPPERILVINRGGGVLDWTVRTSHTWVETVVDQQGVDLHLSPTGPGVHRANVYVTDERTGTLKTIRLRVVVARAASHAAPAAPVRTPSPPRPTQPAPSTRAAADTSRSAAARPIGDGPEPTPPVGGSRWSGHLALAAGVAAVVAGATTALTAHALAGEAYDSDNSKDLWWRGEWGPGVIESLIAGVLLALAALGVLSARRRATAAAAVAVGAAAVAALRRAEVGELREDWSWLDAWSDFDTTSLLPVIAAGLGVASVAAGWGHRVIGPPRRPGRRGAVLLVATAVWTIGLGVDLYEIPHDGVRFGDHTSERLDGTAFQVLVAVIIVAAVLAAVTVLRGPLADGALLGAALVPFSSAIAEVGFTLKWQEFFEWGWELVLFALAATALTAPAVIATIRGPGPQTATSGDQVRAISTSS